MGNVSELPKEECTGCGACSELCPSAAIAMAEDEEGFQYPAVRGESCTECGLCLDRCPARSPLPDVASGFPLAFAVWHKDDATRVRSTSGGAFYGLAKTVLEQGGVVFGAAWTDRMSVRHVAVREVADLQNLQGSKYVQSECHSTFDDVQLALRQGERVLYSGTPCQIAGLVAFLGGRPEGLTTCELVCHGVPSQKVLQGYFDSFRAGGVSRIVFRTKTCGWQFPTVEAALADGTRYCRWYMGDPFIVGFIEGVFLRPSCYSCKYHDARRAADLTLGDFWGVQTVVPGCDLKMGVSLAIASSAAGEALLRSANGELSSTACEFGLAAKENPRLLKSAARPIARGAFFEVFGKAGFSAASRTYFPSSKFLSHWLRRQAKRLRSFTFPNRGKA